MRANHRTPARNGATLGLALLAASCFVDTGGSGASDSVAASTSSASTSAGTGTAELTTMDVTTGEETTDTTSGTEALDTSTASATTDETSAAETTGAAVCDEDAPLLAMSSAVQGVDLTTRAVGDELCALEFGEGWQWLDFHYQSQWKVIGRWLDELGEGERGWVIILDNNGNCSESTHGMTWYRAPGSCATTCGSPLGLEGPDFMPHGPDAICNPYDGDTPCELARPIVCVFAGP